MAKIIKVGSQNLTPNKIANPFRTSRNSTTNPFKYSNFEGNTLQFADVFEGFEPKHISKMKMIASSAVGSMSKIKSIIPESIVNFVNKVCGGVAKAWDYANNTNFSDAIGFNSAKRAMNEFGTGFTSTMSAMSEKAISASKGIYSSTKDYLSKDALDVAKDMADMWSAMIGKININKHHYSADMPVSELETALRAELALAGGI